MASSPAPVPEAPAALTERGRQKADRRAAILAAAATLFAERGYAGVTIEDLGTAVGVSGPAVYRHFPGKAAVLAAILEGASRALLDGAERVLGEASGPDDALRALIAHHVDFALGEADVILVQDRELEQLDRGARHEVRLLQRRYVENWVDVLSRLRPDRAEAELRVRAHAAFGLLNSTPHSARIPGRRPAEGIVRGILEEMAWASLMS
ncbi:TetR/AcrR family transcriptional regulator [Agromyces sp. H3Y2-19a]|jgi:AcrR family transcriptional regulator|uniref:TetR/AcrR family transcriptional regulator n=1 Tax=Agromyces TaxID=33877 RepID=UPI001E2D4B0C|nr:MULTISPECIES: TetR/AcrR family transcriptional regulator [Agromyces]MCD5347505.1 TetR/AcrR family transcriptional regulator [Agromyces sp. S2-1-8]MDF0514924.1 TetR/AcrR family transcriptional regulator [Agromyces chromiiresistens]